METYILSDIDKFGNFSLTLNGISPQNFCIFSRKTKEAGIPMRIVELFGVKKTLASTYEHFAAVKNILTEIGMSPQVTSYTFIPVSSRDNKDIVINVESYSLGDMHITVSKFSPIFYYIIKNLFAENFSSIASIENDFIITSLNYENLKNFIDVLNKSNFNTTSMTPFLNLVPKSMDDNKNPIVLAEQSDVKVNGWLLKITINYGANDPILVNEKLYKIISFVFPLNTTSLNSTDMNEKVAEISVPGRKVIYFRCQYRDLKTLQLLLEKNNFNTVAMEKVIDSLVSSKALNKTRIDGEMDGVDQTEFQKYISYYENNFFYNNTNYSDNEKHFFPAQIKGIEFLYSRQGALLGDAVGVGKTLMSVVAADIRMKTSGGSCLIITKEAVVPQLCTEIQRITKENSSEISVHYATPSKWTVISYNIFQEDTLWNNEPIRKVATRILSNYAKANRFTVCILDEIHMIKNGDPSDRDSTGSLDHIENHRTFNVQEITKHIPFVWGASATIVANKPKDLFNQLKAINHNIGNMDYRKFVEQFDSNNSDSLVDKFKKSDMIRDLMTDQGIYMRRSKSEVNENMPEMEVVTKKISLTPAEIDKIMSGVKGSRERPGIDQTSIIRKRIAIAKVDNTVDLAESVLTAGRKVAVFTAHTESLKKIKDDLGLILERVYPGENKTVASIDGSQNKDQRQAQIQGFKSKGSNMMAIVISIDAGGTGLDFPNILTDVIVNDFDWSPSDDDQSIGRFYRINSREKVNVTYVIAQNTLDRKYFDLLNEKKKIAERIQTLSDEESNEIAKMSGSSSERLLEIRKRKYQELLSLDDLNKEYRQEPTS